MTDPTRLRRDAERNRDLILAAARRLFTDTGQAVTHNEVARAAGVGVGTVYRRFPDREHLMRALFEDQVELVGRLAEDALAAEDPEAGLRRFLEQVVELQAADRGLQEHMLGPQARSLAGAATSRIAPAVSELLDRAQQRGQIRDDVTTTDVALIPMMVSAVLDRSRGIAPEAFRRALRIALDGLRPADRPLPGTPLAPEEFEQLLSRGRQPG